MKILGVMTGTSCDGLDAACLEVKLNKWKTLWTASAPYSQELRKRVLEFQLPNQVRSIQQWLELDRDLGSWYGSTLNKLIQKNKPIPDVIANHGQTLAHFPKEGAQGTTLQLGDGSRIAAATGLTVVHQFRKGDMAAGGQGAPLVPLFHELLAQKLRPRKVGLAIHNIGGISNLTYIGPKRHLMAFDTGPGNIWIDAAVSKVTQGKSQIDWGGKLAEKGSIDEKAVTQVLNHPFFQKQPPKATGRDDFPFEFFSSKTQATGNSLVATATQITVESIGLSYENWILKKGLPLVEILICGGGAKNRTLLNQLKKRLPEIQISSLSDWGFDSQAIEAQAFSLFGFHSLHGKPLGGTWTGASCFGPPGFLIPGKNWKNVMKKLEI